MIKSTVAAVAASTSSSVALPSLVPTLLKPTPVSTANTVPPHRTHIGYESSISDNADWFIQGDPANEVNASGNAPTELSGKLGASVAIATAVKYMVN